MKIEIEIGLTREELEPYVQINTLVQLAEQMVRICGETPREAVLALLAAAAVSAIRDAPPGEGVAPELKALMVDAMQVARQITKPLPRSSL